MRKSAILTIAIGLALSACEDTAGPEGDRLSRSEALLLTAQVMASSEGAATTAVGESGAGATVADGRSDALGGPPTSFTHTHESTHPCPSGGQVAVNLLVTGMFDDETNSMQADLAGSHTHTGCAVPHQNITITLDGEPSIAFTASIGAENGVPSQPFTFTLDGAFSWAASDGRSGLCELDLDAVTDFAARERTVSGSVCGHTITQTTTWS